MFKKKTGKSVIAIAIGIVLAVLLFTIRDTMDDSLLVDKLMVKLITALMIIAVLLLSVYISGGAAEHDKTISFVSFVGKNAFEIYIYGWPFQAVIEAVLSVYMHLPIAVVFIAKFICGIVCPLFLVFIYERFFVNNRIIKVMLGK